MAVAATACVATFVQPLDAQTRKPRPKPSQAKPVPQKTEPATLECPSLLGTGLQTKRTFCDVLTGQHASAGVIIKLPPHTGPVVLSFDLHNRHTYSEELVKTNRAYRRYTATVGVMAADNTLLTRAVVQNEFRTEADLVDRVAGGAGPGGVKAVAPTGTEHIELTVTPQDEKQSLSILGEKLTVVRADADTPDNFSAAGRPIAIVSNVQITYRPAPAPAPRRR